MAPPSFVQEHVPSHAALLARPHVTLTWAQSLDSKIAGLGGKRVVLSGPESMLMTHHPTSSPPPTPRPRPSHSSSTPPSASHSLPGS
ncbi:2,5-diamino-6-(ribosylamino)-4(3H)-pyrimidinone 5'-phosphate reductase [Cryptococcus neoformans Bt120]|nr:2,5-diamino-6-(ribosylamino)-4(3H)-pyrimidinone 5'-phosphate reductase [Cryptococcus neoformans var. grubii Bt120]